MTKTNTRKRKTEYFQRMNYKKTSAWVAVHLRVTLPQYRQYLVRFIYLFLNDGVSSFIMSSKIVPKYLYSPTTFTCVPLIITG